MAYIIWLIKKIEMANLGYLSSITHTDKQLKNQMSTKALQMRIEELEKLTVTLTEKLLDLESRSVEKVETTKKIKATGLKKDGTPRKKRAPCGYMIFSNDMRAEVREDLLEEAEGEKVPPGAVVKKLAELWNAMDDEEKEPYNTRAKEMVDEEE